MLLRICHRLDDTCIVKMQRSKHVSVPKHWLMLRQLQCLMQMTVISGKAFVNICMDVHWPGIWCVKLHIQLL